MKLILSIIIIVIFSSCTNMTPEQQTQWSTTGNILAQRAADLALEEAAARLRQTRDNK